MVPLFYGVTSLLVQHTMLKYSMLYVYNSMPVFTIKIDFACVLLFFLALGCLLNGLAVDTVLHAKPRDLLICQLM